MRWDILVPLVVYMAVIAAIGVWANRRLRRSDHSSAEYFLAGRTLGWIVLVFTLLTSIASAGTFVGGPGLGYELGFGWVLASLGQASAAFVVLGVLGMATAP